METSADSEVATIASTRQASSDILQGSIWSEGGEYKPIEDKHHLHSTYRYIRLKREPGTILWSHNEDENWIDHPDLGVIIMSLPRKRIRIFAQSSDPAS